MKYVSGSLYISQILLNVHQNPSRTPSMAKKKLSEHHLLQILQNNIIVIKLMYFRRHHILESLSNTVNGHAITYGRPF